MLSIKNIVVHYGGVEALKGVSINVEEGSVTCLLGANGAGKSTCLRAISGLVPLTSGEIWFEGKRMDGMAPENVANLGIAHIPERKRLFYEMSVFDNLMTGAFLRKDKLRIKKDLEKCFKYFPVLGKRRRQVAKRMSGGEQQMIAFGRGLLSNAKLFLFDEPSLGIAPILVKEMKERIKWLADEGCTILLVEQNVAIALELAKKGYVLEMGRIVLEGDARELQNSEYVREAYLGM